VANLLQSQSNLNVHKRQELVNSYFQKAAPFWREIYQTTGVLEFIHQERLRAIVDLIEKTTEPHASRVLDIGCGAGLISIALAKHGYMVHAADPVSEMIELTRKGATAENQEARITC
jgi:2-polyprenyl-3-methyl-5-hydroxy-6-metoxy-1,4-benzoquinol methylase